MNKSMAFPFIILLLGITLFIKSLEIKGIMEEPMGPESFPQVVALLIIAAALVNIFIEWRNGRKNNLLRSEKQEGKWAANKKVSYLPPLCIGILGFLYVLGLDYLGFYSSTFLFALAVPSTISYFKDPASVSKTLITRSLPISIGILFVLYMAVTFMHIYLPEGGILW
jgi:hypothetical protein